MTKKKRIPTSGETIAWPSPFTVLKNVSLPQTPEASTGVASCDAPSIAPKRNRGLVDIIRRTPHRGGKTMTVITGLTRIGQTDEETLAKKMQKTCGARGTVKEGRIQIQGDQREAVARILTKAGFRPVFAGG